MPETWKNWSGEVIAAPARIETPDSEEALITLVKQAAKAKQPIRVTGTGHSFTPLCATDGMLVSLDGMQGMVSVDLANLNATVWGGTKLWQLGDPLREAGMAMDSMGDIDRQSIAGAISTGTHGTGHGVGSISRQVIGLRLIAASGDIVECSAEKNPELLKAAQVSLGALGIVSQVTLRLVPAYRLHERQWNAMFDECFASLDKNIQENRHFEFFWVSTRPKWKDDSCLMKSLNPTSKMPHDLPDKEGERIDHSARIFPSVRNNLFNEIEFAVPEANGPECLLELRQLMLHKHPDIAWPLEYRTVGADDILLSPAYKRDTVTISAHQAADLEYRPFFKDVEAVFRNHQGRPHWGKIHTHTRDDLRALYPMWDRFHAIRRELDPEGLFLNGYLKGLFS